MYRIFNLFKVIKQIFRNYKIVTILIILFSMIMAITVWFSSIKYYNSLAEHEFNHKVNENINNFQKKIAHYENLLMGAKGLLNVEDNITQEKWHNFLNAINIEANYPGLQSLGYSPITSKEKLSLLEQKIINEGNKDFKVYPPGKRDIYLPVIYIEPKNERNKKAIGYDLYTENNRKLILDLARDTGSTSISNKVTLVQEISDDKQSGILMYLPIYIKKSKQNTVKERRNSIKGFVSGVFRVNDMMNNIVLIQSVINFEIYDNEKKEEEYLVYKTFNTLKYQPKFSAKKTISMYNEKWYMNFYSTKNFDQLLSYQKPLIFTLISILIYFILLSIILSLIHSKKLLQFKTNELFKLSQSLEQSPLSICITDKKGYIEYVNQYFNLFPDLEKSQIIGLNINTINSKNNLSKAFKTMKDKNMRGKISKEEFSFIEKGKISFKCVMVSLI